MKAGKFTFVGDGETSLAERKRALRQSAKRRRAETVNRDVKERRMVEHFFGAGLGDKNKYFVYVSYSSEASTELLIKKLLEKNKRVFCPRVEGENMVLVPLGEDFTLSDRGIKEPVGRAYEGNVDVCVCPLLAADLTGARLGYGGGFYDKFLNENKDVLAVGWCFESQLVQSVPSEDHDARMRVLVTEDGARTIKQKTEA